MTDTVEKVRAPVIRATVEKRKKSIFRRVNDWVARLGPFTEYADSKVEAAERLECVLAWAVGAAVIPPVTVVGVDGIKSDGTPRLRIAVLTPRLTEANAYETNYYSEDDDGVLVRGGATLFGCESHKKATHDLFFEWGQVYGAKVATKYRMPYHEYVELSFDDRLEICRRQE